MASRKILTIEKKISNRLWALFGEMEAVRKELKSQIKGITQEEIDFSPDMDKFETIGTQILHVTDSENWWIRRHLNNEEYNTEKWKYAVALQYNYNPRQLTGQKIDFYINLLDEVRKNTENQLSKLKNDDLEKVFKSEIGEATLEWVLFHIHQHESHHIGQINLLRRLYKLQSI